MDPLLLGLLLLLPMTLTFWAIVHVAAVARFERPLARFGWLGVVTFLPVVGALLYLAAGRPKAAKPQNPSA